MEPPDKASFSPHPHSMRIHNNTLTIVPLSACFALLAMTERGTITCSPFINENILRGEVNVEI